jgi:photosystem II stability/assembly factor-like uncharacterized protein
MRLLALWFAGLILGSAPAFSSGHAAATTKHPVVNENFYGVEIVRERAWIVGYYGTILHSTDRGQTWQIQSSPTRNALFTVRFVSASQGSVSGSYGTVLQTSDGGKSWRAQSIGTTEHLFASYWLDESHGWMAGSRGITTRTNDGGRSWAHVIVPGDFTLNGLTFLDASRGWLAGEFGAIFQTLDGGKSWVKQKSPVEVSFASGASQNLFALLFTSPADGYAFGLDGLVLRTRDGARWEILRRRENTDGTNSANHLFTAAAFNGRISAAGERGTLLQYDPDSGNWRQAGIQIPRLSLNAMAFGKDGLGLAVGNRGLVLRTEDGGKSWKRLKIEVHPRAP